MTDRRRRPLGVYVRVSVREEKRWVQSLVRFRSAAEAHAPAALESLASLAKNAASESVRVSAANAVLDRAYGKPAPGVRWALSDEAEPRRLEIRWRDPKSS